MHNLLSFEVLAHTTPPPNSASKISRMALLLNNVFRKTDLKIAFSSRLRTFILRISSLDPTMVGPIVDFR